MNRQKFVEELTTATLADYIDWRLVNAGQPYYKTVVDGVRIECYRDAVYVENDCIRVDAAVVLYNTIKHMESEKKVTQLDKNMRKVVDALS